MWMIHVQDLVEIQGVDTTLVMRMIGVRVMVDPKDVARVSQIVSEGVLPPLELEELPMRIVMYEKINTNLEEETIVDDETDILMTTIRIIDDQAET